LELRRDKPAAIREQMRVKARREEGVHLEPCRQLLILAEQYNTRGQIFIANVPVVWSFVMGKWPTGSGYDDRAMLAIRRNIFEHWIEVALLARSQKPKAG
jgi:hypothetical protein